MKHLLRAIIITCVLATSALAQSAATDSAKFDAAVSGLQRSMLKMMNTYAFPQMWKLVQAVEVKLSAVDKDTLRSMRVRAKSLNRALVLVDIERQNYRRGDYGADTAGYNTLMQKRDSLQRVYKAFKSDYEAKIKNKYRDSIKVVIASKAKPFEKQMRMERLRVVTEWHDKHHALVNDSVGYWYSYATEVGSMIMVYTYGEDILLWDGSPCEQAILQYTSLFPIARRPKR